MRLGDLDALLEKVWDVDCRCGYVQVVDRADIETAPTIDPEDLRPKGRWISYLDGDSIMPERYYRCSRCGRAEDKKEPYCHCGAKMEGM